MPLFYPVIIKKVLAIHQCPSIRKRLQHRKNIIDLLQIMKRKAFIVEGVFMSIQKGFVEDIKEQAGEFIN